MFTSFNSNDFQYENRLKYDTIYGWYGRKIPVSKGTPVTMPALFFLAVYMLFI